MTRAQALLHLLLGEFLLLSSLVHKQANTISNLIVKVEIERGGHCWWGSWSLRGRCSRRSCVFLFEEEEEGTAQGLRRGRRNATGTVQSTASGRALYALAPRIGCSVRALCATRSPLRSIPASSGSRSAHTLTIARKR
jgi:hypothetical protein